MDFPNSLIIVGWFGLHLAGLIIGWATRLTAGSRFDWLLQLAFFTLLATLSGAAWISHHYEFGLWIPTGFTMVAMLLMAVTDFDAGHNTDHHSPRPHYEHLR